MGSPDPSSLDGGDEVLALVNKYVVERERSGEINTRSGVCLRSRLRLFAASTKSRPGKLTRGHVERWLASDPDWSPAYRRSCFYAVRGFSQWMVMKRVLKSDITLGIRTPKVSKGMMRAFVVDDARAIVAVAGHDDRTRLVTLLMLQEGLRRAEVAAAQLGDIDLRKRTIAVRGKGYRGEQSRTVPISDETYRALVRYMDAVKLGPGFLIRSVKNPDRGITPAYVSHIILQVLREAGVKAYNGDGKSAHALRHTCAQDVLDSGADIRQVQKLLGHATIKTTEEYLRGDVKGLREAMSGREYGETG